MFDTSLFDEKTFYKQLAMFGGELVDEVRTYYAQDSKSKEIIKHLLLINNHEITSNFPLMRHK